MLRAKSVDAYIERNPQWAAALKKLRKILNATELEETVKWGGPCYTYEGKNVVGLGSFKSYVGLWFHQGALLKDEAKVLINAQEGKRGGKGVHNFFFRLDFRQIDSHLRSTKKIN